MSFDKDAIKELTKAQAISAASESLDHRTDVVALPEEFKVHDLERYSETRRRARGSMTTSVAGDFAAYVGKHANTGASVFVDVDAMAAVAVLNLGTSEFPGHADNTATLAPKKTAAYKSLKAITDGQARPQKVIAEWMEDWSPCIKCFVDEVETPIKKAVAAVRKITIEALRKVEASEQQLSAQRSAFESVTASSTEALPTRIEFTTEPYGDFNPRTFSLRMSVLTSDKPALALRIANAEKHDEEMAEELAQKVNAALVGGSVSVVLGTYSVRT